MRQNSGDEIKEIQILFIEDDQEDKNKYLYVNQNITKINNSDLIQQILQQQSFYSKFNSKLFQNYKIKSTAKGLNMNSLNYRFGQESDSETVTQTETIQQPIVTLEYLLNQNKMKEIALTKATHLIQLYKIQLQVKQQDYLKQIQLLKHSQRQNYQHIITELEEKSQKLQKQLDSSKENYQRIISQLEDQILKLEKQLHSSQNKIIHLEKKYKQTSQLDKLYQSTFRIPKITRNNSGKDLNLNKKGRYSHSKNVSTAQINHMRRSLSNFFNNQAIKDQDLYRIQKTFLIKYLLQNQQKDQKIGNILQSLVSTNFQSINESKGTIKGNQKFMEQFLKHFKQPYEMESRLKEYKEIIKIQELIIEQLNGQLSEYQDLFNVMNGALEQIFQKENDFYFEEARYSLTASSCFDKNQQKFEDFRNTVHETQNATMNKIKQHKSFIKQKINNMEAQNKQLKRILDDMIKLVKNNKKIQALSFGNIRNPKSSQDLSYSKQKAKSQVLYGK